MTLYFTYTGFRYLVKKHSIVGIPHVTEKLGINPVLGSVQSNSINMYIAFTQG